MRLWHQSLIPLLPRQQLLGQHRECAALRGNGWGKKHSTVNYVFEHHWYKLYIYHVLVMIEMGMRGYNVQDKWLDYRYRGTKCEAREELSQEEKEQFFTDLPVLGDGVTCLYSLLMVCKDCGADIWNEKLEEITLRRAFRKYYRKNKDKEDVVAWYKNLKYRRKQRKRKKLLWLKWLDKLFKM